MNMNLLPPAPALTKRGKPRRRSGAGTPIAERLALHVLVNADSGCWEWQATLDQNGYGRLTISKTLRYAHRVAYEQFVGPIGIGLEVDHLCRNRACCNPEHLEAVTAQVNTRRGMSVGAIALRRDACVYGHLYSEWGVISCGRRICRFCRVAYLRAYKQTPFQIVMERKSTGKPVVDLKALYADADEMSRLGLPDLLTAEAVA